LVVLQAARPVVPLEVPLVAAKKALPVDLLVAPLVVIAVLLLEVQQGAPLVAAKKALPVDLLVAPRLVLPEVLLPALLEAPRVARQVVPLLALLEVRLVAP
jgi:hypothetical protein